MAKPENGYKTLVCRLHRDDHNRIEKLAKTLGTSMTRLVVLAIEEYRVAHRDQIADSLEKEQSLITQ